MEVDNDKLRVQLDECQWQRDKHEENLDRISDAVDFTVSRCKV